MEIHTEDPYLNNTVYIRYHFPRVLLYRYVSICIHREVNGDAIKLSVSDLRDSVYFLCGPLLSCTLLYVSVD